MFASRFRYMAIADNKQRIMPFPEDRQPRNCQELAYPEAVILTHPKDPALQGEVGNGRFDDYMGDLCSQFTLLL